MSKNTKTKTAKNAAKAAAKLAEISAKAEGKEVSTAAVAATVATKTVSKAKSEGKVLEKFDHYQLQPVNADLQLMPELVDPKRRAERPVFDESTSAHMIAELRATEKYTQVKRWKSGNGFTVWASTRPLDEVRADREKALGITIKARTAEVKVKMAEGKVVQTQA